MSRELPRLEIAERGRGVRSVDEGRGGIRSVTRARRTSPRGRHLRIEVGAPRDGATRAAIARRSGISGIARVSGIAREFAGVARERVGTRELRRTEIARRSVVRIGQRTSERERGGGSDHDGGERKTAPGAHCRIVSDLTNERRIVSGIAPRPVLDQALSHVAASRSSSRSRAREQLLPLLAHHVFRRAEPLGADILRKP